MSSEMKVAIITGVFSLLVGAMGMYANMQNKEIKVTVEGQEQSIQINDFQSVIDDLQIKKEDLNNQIDKLTKKQDIDNSIDLLSLKPIIGQNEKFWQESDTTDNLGNGDYSYKICCQNKEITYPLDKKYSTLKGTLALSDFYNNAQFPIWIEFYDNDTNKKIGSSVKFREGSRPTEFEIDVSGVGDLRIIGKSDLLVGGDLLTNGFMLVK